MKHLWRSLCIGMLITAFNAFAMTHDELVAEHEKIAAEHNVMEEEHEIGRAHV